MHRIVHHQQYAVYLDVHRVINNQYCILYVRRVVPGMVDSESWIVFISNDFVPDLRE